MSAPPSFALVTSSWRGDLERCRLLCRSVDRHVTGFRTHYLLVEERDLALFAEFSSPHRRVVSERELLPRWLRPVTEPLRGRRLWLQPFGPPLRGWHVQQLRRFAMAARMEEEAMVSLDSDVAFLRPFDVRTLAGGGRVRFHRVPGAITQVEAERLAEHERWSRRAGQLLGIREPRSTQVGYIATLIAWRRDTAEALLEHVARSTGRSAMAALAASRALSECTIYGRFVDEVEGRPDRHEASDRQLCAIYWDGPPLDEEGLRRFLQELAPEQVAIGLQSFTGTDPALVRRVLSL